MRFKTSRVFPISVKIRKICHNKKEPGAVAALGFTGFMDFAHR
jgi:hypothetical protein